MHTPSLDISLRVSVPIELVWCAITEPDARATWWPQFSFTPEPGAAISVETPRPRKKKPRSAKGTITSIDDGEHELHAEWTATPGGYTTQVHLLVSETKRRCKIRVIEEGFPTDRDDAQVIVAESRNSWRDHLAGLATYLEDAETIATLERSVTSRTRRTNS